MRSNLLVINYSFKIDSLRNYLHSDLYVLCEFSGFKSPNDIQALAWNIYSLFGNKTFFNNKNIILSFDIAPFPYKRAQRRITFHCQRIDVDIHIVN